VPAAYDIGGRSTGPVPLREAILRPPFVVKSGRVVAQIGNVLSTILRKRPAVGCMAVLQLCRISYNFALRHQLQPKKAKRSPHTRKRPRALHNRDPDLRLRSAYWMRFVLVHERPRRLLQLRCNGVRHLVHVRNQVTQVHDKEVVSYAFGNGILEQA